MNVVRLAAAGSGKTWGICHDALEIARKSDGNRVLMVTYTNRGLDSIRIELKKQNYGVIPSGVVILSWYQFLLRELIRPYQTYIAGINEINGFDYSLQHSRNFAKAGTKARYITKAHNVRSEEASNLALLLNEKSKGKVFKRLENAYSHIFIDEIQDMAGRDLNILWEILCTSIVTVCVGDNKQATFQTHTAKINRDISGANVFDFFAIAQAQGIAQIEKNLCSRRFNADICNFANRVHPNSNNMMTSMNETTGHDGVFIIEHKDAPRYYSCYYPQELRYDRTKNTCSDFALNFGECKGRTFDRCLIYGNKPLVDFLKGKRLSSPAKYYVAVTRARFSNVIVVDSLFDALDFEDCEILVENGSIPAKKFIGR